MPLIELEPPRSLPRTQYSGRKPLPGSGSVGKTQVNPGLDNNLPIPFGICTSGWLSSGPASISNTRDRLSLERRSANTQPADPAPTMM